MGRYRDLTYRTKECHRSIGVDVAIHLYKKSVVIYMPMREHPWRRGKLTGVLPASNRFRVTWSNGRYSNLVGLWRIHDARLFSRSRLPRPTGPARVPSAKQTNPKEGSVMATKTRVKKGSKAKASSNGGFNLKDASAAEKKRIAAQIKRLRKDGVGWDGDGGVCEQVGISSALQGRTLLREYGGEDLIREQDAAPAKKSSTKKPAAKKATTTKKASGGAKRKVVVKRGRGKAANPS